MQMDEAETLGGPSAKDSEVIHVHAHSCGLPVLVPSHVHTGAVLIHNEPLRCEPIVQQAVPQEWALCCAVHIQNK